MLFYRQIVQTNSETSTAASSASPSSAHAVLSQSFNNWKEKFESMTSAQKKKYVFVNSYIL